MKEIKSWFVDNKRTIISAICMAGSVGLSILQSIKQKDEIREVVDSYYKEITELNDAEKEEIDL